MTFEEFLAGIKSKYSQYDKSGLINSIDVYSDVLYAVKSLGLLVLEKGETIVHIKNGKGTLPSGFSRLISAIKCTPFEYDCDEEDESVLQSMYFSQVKNIKRTEWPVCDPCNETHSEEVIVESVYFHKKRKGNIRYNQPTYLKLTDYVKKNICDKDCPNKAVKDSPYEINIKGNTIYANFKEGSIYIKYKGLEEDDDGFIIIPDSEMGHVEKYVTAHVLSEIMLQSLMNSDNTTNEQTLYSETLRRESDYKALAITELKFKGLGKAMNKYKKVVKREFNTFNF